jgi:excisionase family DNA binding protein
MEYINIMEAARRCHVSDKTIRRWIHAHKLPAHFPHPNRCEIAVGDLEPFLPGHLSGQDKEPIERRIATLEHQVQALECQIQQLLRHPVPSRTPTTRKRVMRESTSGPLPTHLVSVLAVARLHGIAEQKVQTHIDIHLLPVHRGTWVDAEKQEVLLAFDAKGLQAFYHLYHEFLWFVACPHCPHGLTGQV